MRKYLLILYLLVFLSAQSSNTQVPLSPVVTYWKALTIEEKETFLFSYLVQVYETHSDLKKDIGYGGITEWYYDNRAELIYGIFDHLDQVGIYQMVKWVDEYYAADKKPTQGVSGYTTPPPLQGNEKLYRRVYSKK